MHIDLIIGLPSETIESFGKNLNQLYTLSTGEIQVGILKNYQEQPLIDMIKFMVWFTMTLHLMIFCKMI